MLNLGFDPTVFDSDLRAIIAKADIYFDGLNQPPVTVTKDDYLVDFHLLEEAGAEDNGPTGVASANELTLTLYNEQNRFSVINVTGPYAGKIKAKIPIRLYVKQTEAVYDTGVDGWVPMGTYYVNDWVCDSGSTTASITGYDKLYNIGQYDTPMIYVKKDTTLAAMLSDMFIALGLVVNVDFVVDTSLTQVVKYGWLTAQKVLATLQDFTKIGFCFCYVRRDGILAIVNIRTIATSVASLTDDNQIVNVSLPQSNISTYDGLEVSYTLPGINPVQSVLGLSKITIPPGVHTLLKIQFTTSPVLTISHVEVLNGENTDCTDVAYNSNDCTLTFHNVGNVDEVLDINVYAWTLVANTATQTTDVDDSLAPKRFQIGNYLLQDTAYIAQLTTILLKFIQSHDTFVIMHTRGNPLLELSDTVTCTDAQTGLSIVGKCYRFEYTFDGTLSCDIKVMNTTTIQ